MPLYIALITHSQNTSPKSCHAMAFEPVVRMRYRAGKRIRGAWGVPALPTGLDDHRVFLRHCSQGLKQMITRLCRSVQYVGALPSFEITQQMRWNHQRDWFYVCFLFFRSLSFSSVYVSVPSGPITDQQQYRADVRDIARHYVCYIVMIYDVCNVIRINLCVHM